MMQLGSSVLVALITAGGYVMVAWINGNNKQQQKEIANNFRKNYQSNAIHPRRSETHE